MLLVASTAELPAAGEGLEPLEETEGRATIELFQDSADETRWRLRHRNGDLLADSGERYADRSGAWEAIKWVKRNTPATPVEETE